MAQYWPLYADPKEAAVRSLICRPPGYFSRSCSPIAKAILDGLRLFHHTTRTEHYNRNRNKHKATARCRARHLTKKQRSGLLSAYYYLPTCSANKTKMRSSRKNGGASSTGASSSATTHKRKRKPGEARYYAVRAGRIPGVYTTWDECQSMINGFSGAQCKSSGGAAQLQEWMAIGPEKK